MPRPHFDYPTLLKDILTISPILLRNISKMLRNKSFDFRAKFGAIYSASETKEYVLKNIPIDNRIWFKNRQTLELLVPKIRSGGSF